ncbi:facilitated trehalose transporter Tret1-like isoform X1 [Pectinophora gossypiella]|uniref:facilitated trehalose transporter Tret1-like isoform X1 n=1 Tax=Pectinophora gossypiella TaxID=13191 RepID=UPI00214E0B45|nr:facilitated trehalose transporter Tret1-like isoform X1 [Pectinophora gossypiella]
MTKQTKRNVQYLAGLCASLGFVFTGAVLTWGSPAIPKFKSGEANIEITDAQSSWVVSLLSLGSIPGCYIGQLLIERVGRRRTICVSSVPGLVGAAIILFTKYPILMIIARMLMGVSTGMTAMATMIYITEIADKEIRGALGMLVQVMGNIGGLIMYGVGPFVSYTVLNSIVLSIPIVYAAACVWIPESPYYYLKDDRMAQAKKEFMVIKGTKDEKWADDQLGVIRAHVRENMENKTTFTELMTNMKYRKTVFIVAGLKALQYMTGASAIQSYLEIIFRQSSTVSGPHVSIIYGFVQLAAGIGATFLAGWFGRRVLLFLSCLGVAVSLTLVGIYFYLQDSIGVSQDVLASISALPLVGILGFNILYAVGIGNLPYVLQAELFPINVKTVASSAATILACVLSFSVAKCYQGIKDNFGHYTVFWSFAFVAYVGVFFIYCFVPETKGKTLEEVHDNMAEKPAEAEALREKAVNELTDDC